MTVATNAERSLQEGDPFAALKYLEEEIRSKPSDVKLRIFLFQLLVVHGQWQRALNQLDVIGQMDAAALAMVQMYRDAIRCELLRTRVFSGEIAPMVFGQPNQWLAFLVEAISLSGKNEPEKAQAMLDTVYEQAPATGGNVDGQKFSWIADADMRLGPVLEVIVNGRYYWLPFAHLSRILIEPPEDLRDLVWMPAHLWFENGGDSVALIPTRYPETQASHDCQLVMAKKTVWNEVLPELFYGLGQRVLTTDAGEVSLMDVREVQLNTTQPATIDEMERLSNG